jgi:small subunit ribosomal protein S15
MIYENPEWVPIGAAEIEELVIRFAKEGMVSARIGLVLRDQYGVPNVKLATGKSVTAIMEEHDVASSLPEDLSNLMRRAIELATHVKEHKRDVANKRGLLLIEARIRRLERYYKKEGILPATWKYSLTNAELMLK